MTDGKLRAVLIGTVETTDVVLKSLSENASIDLCRLITRSKSAINSDFVDLKPKAEARGVPVTCIDLDNKETLEGILQELGPDVVFCVGWSWLLSDTVLEIPRYGCIGYHPAALPKNRGRHPLIWALALGLSQTASSFFVMDGGADTGPILSQHFVPIAADDDARSLYDKILALIPVQVGEVIDQYLLGGKAPSPQDHKQANTWRKRTKVDGEIVWKMDARAVYNLVRALTSPYVGAHTCYKGQEIKIWKVACVEEGTENDEPGKVLSVDGREFTVKCAKGAVRILTHEFERIPESGSYL
ncbi:methionyl-tRNA formyltransferase [Thalassospira povalilytica]|uniref:methionyl-tRNA formyltransferase n=1 Tax=Thalassospira povalilytica TaxID=732237 RepID=UPI003AA936C8